MRNIRLFTLAWTLLFTSLQVFADTEKNPTPSSSDEVINGISYSIPSTYIAGAGGAKIDPMITKGVKFRLNRNASGINNSIEFTVKSGYTISSIDFCGIANDNSKTSTLTAVYVDGIDDAHKLANIPSATLPNKNASAAASFTISGFSATQKIILVFTGTAAQANMEYTVTYTSGAPAASSDATLSALVYGSEGTSVPNFSASQETYEVELPADYVGSAPTIQGTTTHSGATMTPTQATSVPGTATIVVTAEDGTTTKTYTVNFTRASTAPKVTSATWANINGTAVIDNVNKTITGQVTNGSDLTAITPSFVGENIDHWTPTEAQNFSTSAVNYIFFSGNPGESSQYTLTITEAPAVSSDATLRDLRYGNVAVPGFSPTIYEYNIELPAGTTEAPILLAFTTESHATKEYTQAASVPGTGYVDVTAEDGVTTLRYTVNFTASAPDTDLALHQPEVYEAPTIAGGYGDTLSVVDGREYEVYYINREENNLSVSTTTADRTGNITTSSSQTQATAKDGWFFIKGVGSGNAENVTASNEFSGGWRRVNLKDNKDTIQLHVQGFDQFSIYAKDASEGSSARQHIAVYIDGVEQSMTYNKAFTVRRFDCTSSKHLITVTAVGNSTNQVTAFSFRLPKEPRTKWLKGNDSTQVILQTEAPKPVYYFTKHNSLGETRLEWDGPEANGITLSPAGSNPLGDTLVLGGQANCATGVYNYHVIAYKNGTETNRVSGKFTVKSEIKATTDTIISVRQNATMKEIKFRYYALGPNNVHLTWTTAATPNGINGRGNNGTFTISGSTSSPEGDYPFTVSVDGGNSVNGLIKVKSSDLGKDPILFLCSKEAHAESDIVYTYLHQLTGEKKKNLDVLEANSAPREPEEYAPYKWIIISEDVDANNPEILAIIKGGVASNKPVLNLKGFTYWSDRLDWGNTVNGTVDTTLNQENCKIYVQRDDHPIFKGWRNKDIKILDAAKGKQGFMPIEVTNSVLKQSLCLATAYTRNLDDYYENGDLQMVLHEIPASMRGAKYICLSLAGNRALSTDGKELIDRIVNYLTSETPTDITAPKLEITQFSINGTDGIIDPLSDTIKVTFMNQEVDLTALKPVVTLADSKYTFFTPRLKNDETVDFSNSTFKPVDFVVSDYISRRTYHVVVVSKSSQDIEEVYEAGQWVNVFDIFGRKIATTNENIYTMDLPRGMYIVVTESGQTLKIMR